MRRPFAIMLAALWLGIAGCGDDGPTGAAPRPPDGGGAGGGGGIPHTGRNEDAGDDAGDTDAGPVADGGAVMLLDPTLRSSECFAGADINNVTNFVLMPADLALQRVYAHWIGTCNDPVLEIGLSDGTCRTGGGHELLIQIDSNGITDQTLFIPGGNQIEQEQPDRPISIRYRRPSNLTPTGTWGTCADVSGELLVESLDVNSRDALRGSLFATLTPCDRDTLAPFTVSVSFDLPLSRGLSQVCP